MKLTSECLCPYDWLAAIATRGCLETLVHTRQRHVVLGHHRWLHVIVHRAAGAEATAAARARGRTRTGDREAITRILAAHGELLKKRTRCESRTADPELHHCQEDRDRTG